MAIIGDGSINERAAATEFYIQAGAASDISKTSAAHISKHHWGFEVGSMQLAGTAEANLHIGVAVAFNRDGGSSRGSNSSFSVSTVPVKLEAPERSKSMSPAETLPL